MEQSTNIEMKQLKTHLEIIGKFYLRSVVNISRKTVDYKHIYIYIYIFFVFLFTRMLIIRKSMVQYSHSLDGSKQNRFLSGINFESRLLER